MENSWKSLIGKRVLIRDAYGYFSWHGDTTEVRVIEVSPSGSQLKLEFGSGIQLWKSSRKYKVEEVLNEQTRRG